MPQAATLALDFVRSIMLAVATFLAAAHITFQITTARRPRNDRTELLSYSNILGAIGPSPNCRICATSYADVVTVVEFVAAHTPACRPISPSDGS